METKTKPIPEGYHTLTPNLMVRDASRMIDFYKKAFNAEERFRMMTPDNKWIMHAELKIGDSFIMLSDEIPGMESKSPLGYDGSPVGLYVYVEDVDKAFKQAVDAGATVKMPLEDMFWGDRIGAVTDPSGHRWILASHVEDVSMEDLERRGNEAMKKMFAEMK